MDLFLFQYLVLSLLLSASFCPQSVVSQSEDISGSNVTIISLAAHDVETDTATGVKSVACAVVCHNSTNPQCEQTCLAKEDFYVTDVWLRPPNLLCRESDSLIISWNTRDVDNETFIYSVHLYKKDNDNEVVGNLTLMTEALTTNKTVKFTNLTPSTAYILKVVKYSSLNMGSAAITPKMRTLSSDLIPSPPTNISVDLQHYNTIPEMKGIVTWSPSADLTCVYVGMLKEIDGTHTEIVAVIPNNMLSYNIEQLKYSSNYSVLLKAKNVKEGDYAWYSFSTPSCLRTLKSLNVCPPEEPANFFVTETITKNKTSDGKFICKLTITWDAPEYTPDFYIIEIRSLKNTRTYNISGTETKVEINDFTSLKYKITMYAESFKSGKSPNVYYYKPLDDGDHTSISQDVGWSVSTRIWIMIGPLLFLILSMVVGALLYRRYRKLKLYTRRCRYFEDLDKKAPKESDNGSSLITPLTPTTPMEIDAYEIAPDTVKLYELLGEGAFGVVRRGWLPHHNREVAVKMLKENPSAEEMKQFRREMEIMKAVGSHANIVSLIGCCTRSSSTMMLIVEFCSKGDLRNYLRWVWENVVSKSTTSAAPWISSKPLKPSDFNTDTLIEGSQIKYAELMSSENSEGNDFVPTSPNLIVNRLYELQDGIQENENSIITATDLISFGRQIAMGMEFLSSNRVVHRDLAARNVLVCSDKTVKIADFGLSRDIYQENMYRKTGAGKVPIKWMAIESLTHNIYTTQSDVWSFGVLLWEIVTLGATPYPSISSATLPKLLHSGYRMECPTNCSQDLYLLMLACWQARPKDRPSFTDIRQHLDLLLDAMSSHPYLNLESSVNVEQTHYTEPEENAELTRCLEGDQTKTSASDPERYVVPIAPPAVDKNQVQILDLAPTPTIYITGPCTDSNYCNDQVILAQAINNPENTRVNNNGHQPSSLSCQTAGNNNHMISLKDIENMSNSHSSPDFECFKLNNLKLLTNNGKSASNDQLPNILKGTNNNFIINNNDKNCVALALANTCTKVDSSLDLISAMNPRKNSIELMSIDNIKRINGKLLQTPLIRVAAHQMNNNNY